LHEPLVVLRADLRVNTANRAFYELVSTVPQETEGQLIYEVGGGVWDFPEMRELLEQTVPRNRSFRDFEVTRGFRAQWPPHPAAECAHARDGQRRTAANLLAMEDVTERRKVKTPSALQNCATAAFLRAPKTGFSS